MAVALLTVAGIVGWLPDGNTTAAATKASPRDAGCCATIEISVKSADLTAGNSTVVQRRPPRPPRLMKRSEQSSEQMIEPAADVPNVLIHDARSVAAESRQSVSGTSTLNKKPDAVESSTAAVDIPEAGTATPDGTHTFATAARWPMAVLLRDAGRDVVTPAQAISLEKIAAEFISTVDQFPAALTLAKRIAAWNKTQRQADEQLRVWYGQGAWSSLHIASAHMPWPGYVEATDPSGATH